MVEHQRGWSSSNRWICAGCVSEPYLHNVVAAAVEEHPCSFCQSMRAAQFDVFMEGFMVGVDNAFERLVGGCPDDNSECIPESELPNVFSGVVVQEHEAEILAEVSACLVEAGYRSHWWRGPEPDVAYSSAWQKFREQILWRTRFVFWAVPPAERSFVDDDEVPVAKVLEQIAIFAFHINLIVPVSAGRAYFRVRGHDGRHDSDSWGASSLGTNKAEHSVQCSRMSPPGIPMFYGAGDRETALAEVAQTDSRNYFTAARFTTTAPMYVLDLTKVPETPSIFEPELGRWQGEVVFLKALVQELRKRVEPERGCVDYVPTQVFCEYFLRVFSERVVRGVVWQSTVHPAGRCVALDVRHEDCVAASDASAGRLQLQIMTGSKTVHQRKNAHTNDLRRVL